MNDAAAPVVATDPLAAPAAPALPPSRWPRRLAWVVGGLALLLGGLHAALAIALPAWLRPRLEAEGQAWLGTPVRLQTLAIRPLTLELSLGGLVIGPEAAPHLRLGGLEVDVAGESLWRLMPVVSGITVQSPQVWLRRDAGPQAAYDFEPVLAHLRQKLAALPPKPEAPPSAGLPRFELRQIRLAGGEFHIDDARLGLRHDVEALEIALPLVSSDAQRPLTPHLSAKVDGSALVLDAQARPFAPGKPAELSLAWTAYPLAPWGDLLRAVLPPDLAPSQFAGQLDARLQISFAAAASPAKPVAASGASAASPAAAASAQAVAPAAPLHLVVKGELGLSGLAVQVPGRKAALKLARLGLSGLDLAPLARRFVVGKLELQGLDAEMERLAAPPAASSAASASAAQAPAAPPASAVAAAGAEAESAPPLQLELGEFACLGCRIAWSDPTAQPPLALQLAPLDLHMRQITQDLSRPLDLELATGLDARLPAARAKVARAGAGAAAPDQGRLKLALKVSDAASSPVPGRQAVGGLPAALAVQARVDLQGLALAQAQPWIDPYLAIDLQDGRLGLQGDAEVQMNLSGADGRPMPAPRISFRGQLAVDNLHGFIGAAGDELLAWKRLALAGLDLRLSPEAPPRIGLGRIALDGLRGRIIVLPDGHLNVADIVRKPAGEGAAASAPASASAPPASVTPPATASGPGPSLGWEQIRLSDGAVYFTDRHIQPNVSAQLSRLAGTVGAVESTQPEPARVEITGAVEDVAPLRIAGRIHPLGVRAYTDLDATARGIPLTRLSSYAERYAGYAIDKGSLSMVLRYHIENGKLEAENQLFLDQLTFGKESQDPQASKLPVRLAVALLANSKGEIDIRLPVSGTLDDPQFSIGGVLWRVLVNIVTKAITAPFSLLMGGDHQDQSQVDFAAGQDALDEAGRRRLDGLADKLADRPGLKVEVLGQADPARDGEALRHELQARAVAASPAAAASTASAASSASVAASAPTVLDPALVAARLRELADRRADQVMAYLATRLPIERLGLVRSQVAQDDLGEAADTLAPRVQLRLQ